MSEKEKFDSATFAVGADDRFCVTRILENGKEPSVDAKLELFSRAKALGAAAEFRNRRGDLVAHYTREEAATMGALQRAAYWKEKFPHIKARPDTILLILDPITIPRTPSSSANYSVQGTVFEAFMPTRLIVDECPEGTTIQAISVGRRPMLMGTGLAAAALRWDEKQRPADFNWALLQIGHHLQVSIKVPEGSEGRFHAHLLGTEFTGRTLEVPPARLN